eukprot:m.336624 g.336624  ORF g.336624 m.336624 type:complete len:304 (-) comp17909_c0_seq1:24-935(-)
MSFPSLASKAKRLILAKPLMSRNFFLRLPHVSRQLSTDNNAIEDASLEKKIEPFSLQQKKRKLLHSLIGDLDLDNLTDRQKQEWNTVDRLLTELVPISQQNHKNRLKVNRRTVENTFRSADSLDEGQDYRQDDDEEQEEGYKLLDEAKDWETQSPVTPYLGEDAFVIDFHANLQELEMPTFSGLHTEVIRKHTNTLKEICKNHLEPHPLQSHQILRFESRQYIEPNNRTLEKRQKKIIMKFYLSDLRLAPHEAENLVALVGTRYCQQTDEIKLMCERFPKAAQNKEYLKNLLFKLLKEAQKIN